MTGTKNEQGEIEISVGEVSDMQARLVATYQGDMDAGNGPPAHALVDLVGTVRGPFCAAARTLPASFVFRSIADEQTPTGSRDRQNTATAEAVISDPCTWSAELPHLYQVDVEALQGEQVLAEFHGQIGLQRTTARRSYDTWD